MRGLLWLILLFAAIGFLWVAAKLISFVLVFFVPLVTLAAMSLGLLWWVRRRRQQEEAMTLEEWLLGLGEQVEQERWW